MQAAMQNGRFRSYTVFNQLIADADLKAASDFGDAMSAAHWRRNAHVLTRYEAPEHHTLSLYLSGGTGIRRHIGQEALPGGGPGRCCLMPAEVSSDWLVDGEVELFHLYVSKGAVRRAVVETLDIEPSAVELREETFFVDPLIEQTMRHAMLPLDWDAPADRMAVSHAGHMLIGHLLRRYSNRKDVRLVARGGLAPAVRRRTLEFIDANLGAALSLDELAAQAQLSPFHFARMFHQSVGEAPHGYVLRRRIERAGELLRTSSLAVSEIALQCGFSSQAHLTTRFAAFKGVTPARYRALAGR